MSGGFKKNIRIRAPNVLGTKISVENAQFLISTGAPDFDRVIGGGLAIGTLLLIEEDGSKSYSNLLAKLYLAEGLAVGHPLFVASLDESLDKFVSNLPSEVQMESKVKESPQPQQSEDPDLKIAWRYQHLPTGAPNASDKPAEFGHHFDLSRTVSAEQLGAHKITKWSEVDTKRDEFQDDNLPEQLKSLLASIVKELTDNDCWIKSSVPANEQPKQRTVLRVSLLSVGSPLWKMQEKHLPAFFYALRSILRSSCAVCLATVPTQSLESHVKSRCRHVCDYCICPSPAVHVDGKVNPLLSGHNGVFKIHKLPVINSIAPFKPETLDLGFKVRRKKFCIEKLQLPPEVAESEEREQDDVVQPKYAMDFTGCGSMTSKKLDF
ncbi:Hypothetical predicted protein [Cloeon dipterum]|uniref:Elongator complex protein 4 n=1 Tax=Cloeon dipterum TaxID=197152 RepID=A0A8S1D6J7_9INSE|nr:Hypothetical predicted protein [Cloeon dipterum]